MADRWATFDCYGTLIDWERGIADALLALWPGEDRGALLSLYHRTERQERGARPYRDTLAAAVRAIARALGLPLAPGAERALADSLPAWPPFPEVPAALARVRAAGWRIGILSNTDPDLLAASVERIGVEPDLAITVADAGSYKPAHGHWLRFFERSGADRARHVHVAASLFHDIEPCAALGVRAIWVNRQDETSDLPRVAELPDLSDLPAALAVLLRD